MDDGSVCSELVPLSLEDAVQGKTTSLEIPSVFCAKQGKGKAGGRGVAGKNNALTNADGSKVHIVQTSYNLTQNKIMPTITLHTKKQAGIEVDPTTGKADYSARKCILGRLNYAVSTAAPVHVQEKWGQICKLKRGQKKHKSEFLLKWIATGDWTDSYFTQKLNLSVEVSEETRGAWVSKGGLEVLLGKEIPDNTNPGGLAKCHTCPRGGVRCCHKTQTQTARLAH